MSTRQNIISSAWSNFLKRKRADDKFSQMTHEIDAAMLAAQHRMNMDRLHAIQNPAMTVPQNISTGLFNPGGIQGAGIFGPHNRMEMRYDAARMLTTVVIQADNGFILHLTPDNGTQRVLVASSVEELRDLITTELVSKKMEK